jgi:SAM-dependent methyltransferase
MSTDEDWQVWGQRDPYFGVVAHEQFRRERLSQESYDEFFRNGRREFDEILADCRRHCGEFGMQRTLEFGCGVGRMLIPLAEISEECVGVDISDAMRVEAARNCARFNRNNVRLVQTLAQVSLLDTFTFIHSYIVLQHLDTRRGLGIIGELLSRLGKGGCAALHVTYARTKYRRNLGVQPLGREFIRRVRYTLSRVARRLRNRDPQMQMNLYDLNRVLFLAQEHGIRNGGFRFTDHTGHLGTILYLKRE